MILDRKFFWDVMMNETVLFPFFEEISHLCPFSQVQAATDRIQKKYAQHETELVGLAEHVAYVLFRMQATFAADLRALHHIQQVLEGFSPKNMLDLGSGPGGALFASLQAFPSITQATALEKSGEFASFFSSLMKEPIALGKKILFQNKDLGQEDAFLFAEKIDFIIASYSFGELQKNIQDVLLERMCEKTSVLLCVEPGTMAGFETIMHVRKKALELGARIVAPCPHHLPCEMEKTQRWCHESVRLPRTRIHKRLKGGELGYEDEKFCYMCIAFDEKILIQRPPLRIVHVPQHRHGHLFCMACTEKGNIEKVIFSKKHKEKYRQAKEARWGDGLIRP